MLADKMLQSTPPDERELIEALVRGEPAAFDLLVRRHQGRVFGLCLRMLGNAAEAEDVAQEVFLSVFRHVRDFRGESTLSTWLWRITRNHCLNRIKFLRRRKREKERPLEGAAEALAARQAGGPLPGSLPRPDSEAQRRQMQAILEREIAQLTPEHREMIIFGDVEQLSYEEMQKITGLPVGTVKSRLHRARLELARRLAPYLEDEGG